ncbi:MAG: MFS transporter [Chthoniobacterales bacterium]|nr:MFS transporter [Chthoniobacterales bacterium]
MSGTKAIAEFFGLKRNLVILLIATFAIGAGEELWMRFLPKYLQALGATVFIIGLFDALRNFLGAIYAYPGGILVDRWGHRHAFVAFNIFSIAGYALVLLIPHWGAVIAGMFLFLSWTCFSLPASFSLIGASLAANRHATGIGTQAVIKRIPIMIAPFIGGILIDRYGIVSGVRIALAISIVISLGTIFVQRQLRDAPTHTLDRPERWSFLRSVREFNGPLRRLLLSDILVRFCERIPFAWTVIYVMDNLGLSAKQFGVLTTVEMLAATLCIIPASHFADKYGREPFVIATFGFFTLFPLILFYSTTFPMLLFAFTIRGLKEFGDAARKALIIGCAEPGRRGQMVGAYYLIRDLLVSGAALLGAALWKFGPEVNFMSAAAVGAFGTLFYMLTLKRGEPARI